MYDHVDDLIDLGRSVFAATLKLRLGDPTPQRVFAFCIHARIVELSSAVASLFKAHDVVGIPHLVRGELEAFADLRNLVADETYIDSMEAANVDQARKVLAAVVREGIDAGLDDPEGELEKRKQRLSELRAAGASLLNAEQRFQMANLVREYNSVYRYICTHSHNNMKTLEDRHVNKESEPYQLRILLDEIDPQLAVMIELAVKIPLYSIAELRKLGVEGVEDDDLQRLIDKFNDLSAAWSAFLPQPEPASA